MLIGSELNIRVNRASRLNLAAIYSNLLYVDSTKQLKRVWLNLNRTTHVTYETFQLLGQRTCNYVSGTVSRFFCLKREFKE